MYDEILNQVKEILVGNKQAQQNTFLEIKKQYIREINAI